MVSTPGALDTTQHVLQGGHIHLGHIARHMGQLNNPAYGLGTFSHTLLLFLDRLVQFENEGVKSRPGIIHAEPVIKKCKERQNASVRTTRSNSGCDSVLVNTKRPKWRCAAHLHLWLNLFCLGSRADCRVRLS